MTMESLDRNVLVARIVTEWSRGKRITVAIDAKTYSALFHFIPVTHTVHDKSGNPITLVVDRKEAIKLASKHYRLNYGPFIH